MLPSAGRSCSNSSAATGGHVLCADYGDLLDCVCSHIPQPHVQGIHHDVHYTSEKATSMKHSKHQLLKMVLAALGDADLRSVEEAGSQILARQLAAPGQDAHSGARLSPAAVASAADAAAVVCSLPEVRVPAPLACLLGCHRPAEHQTHRPADSIYPDVPLYHPQGFQQQTCACSTKYLGETVCLLCPPSEPKIPMPFVDSIE